MIREASDLLAKLLDGGHRTIAGRLAGGFRDCGRGAIADEIIAAMIAAPATTFAKAIRSASSRS
jgi:hypothetical protein